MADTADADFDVVIAGGGLVGLAGALAFARSGLAVAVVDAARPETQIAESFDGRASAIAYANFRMLERLGLGSALKPHAQRIERILVSDGRAPDGLRRGGPGPAFLRFDHDERLKGLREARRAPDEVDEPLGYMVENRRMRAALLEAVARTPGITMRAPARVDAVVADAARGTVTLDDGSTLSAPLVIGAEGRVSKVRETMGVRVIGWGYGQHGLVATLACEKPHEGVAHEYFLPSGPFAILPLTENRASLVWTEPERAAKAAMALDDETFHAEIMRRFGRFLGSTRVEGPRFAYPLGLALADRFVAPRMALIGDAAHRIHPLAGQGFNLGLKDVAAMTDVLAEALRTGLDLGGLDVLERYQQWRRFDSAAQAVATDVFNRLFSNDLPPVRLARDLGMAAVDRLPFARRLFAKEAGADLGELPSLLKPLEEA